MRPTGIQIIGDVPWGTHFCQFYQDKQDLLDILVPYFKAGLENNEFCMWVTSEPLRAQEAQDALMREIPNLEDYMHKGQIEILDYSQWYTAGGGFKSDRVLQGWVGKLEAALRRGFDGLRLTGNTFWLEKSDWQDFTDYEATVDGVIGRYRMLAICTYSLAKCGAAEIMDVVANHAFALIKRADHWQVIQSSERKRVKASLRASEERYLSLFEQMTEGFGLHEIICDEHGAPCDYRFLEINPAFERLTGLKRADVEGKSMREVLPNDDPKWIEIYGGVALTGKAVRFDHYSSELKRHYNVLAYRPAARQFAVLFTDITERKQAEETVRRESDARYRSLFNSIDSGFCIIEVKFDEAQRPLDYRFLEVNCAFERQTGLVDAEGRWMRSLAPAHEQHWFDIFGAIALTGEPLRFEHQAAALNDRWYEVNAFRVGEPDARRVAILFNDISERKRAEDALRENEERNRRLFASMSEGFGVGEAICDHNGTPTDYRFIDVNATFERRTGLTREMLGKPMREVLLHLRPAWQETFRGFLPTGEPVHLENYSPDTGRHYSLFCYSPARRRFEIVLTDVTDRKRSEERRHARSLLEASLDPLVSISPDGKITDVNEATEVVTGVPREQLIGTSFSEYFTAPRQAEESYRKVLSDGLVRDCPLTIRHVSGRTTDVLFNATVYRNQAGEVQGVFADARDITARKRMEEDLRAASLYARSLLEASLDPLVTISPDGKITDVNQATELVTGVPRERLIGTSFSEYFTAPRQAEEGYHKVLSDGLVRDYPLTIRHAAGHTTDVLYNATVYRNEAGEVQGVFAAARDVTERKRLEEELRVASLYARSLIEASLDPLVTINPEGQITDVNEATELATGVPRDRLIGSDFSDYFTEPDLARAGYRKVLSDGLVRDYALTIRHVAGHTTDVLYNAVVYCNEAGQVQGVFAAARDVTERNRAEAELSRYRDHLEELVRQRTSELETTNTHLQRTTAELVRSNQELEQFAYVASHDLQEPLRAVTGYLGLIERQLGDELDDKARHHLAGAVQGAARMHTLITDLLALSRVGSRGQAFESADLNTVLDQALYGLGVSIQETGATITRDPLPTLRVDAGQIAQVFQNLIGNALKFRGERSPEIHVSAQQKPGQWVFAVRDNGIGIEPQYFERIFLVFQRLHTRQHYPGTGIGLAICKKIVERHDGTIWVDSKPDQSSTFCFTIPDREIL